ncbi:hypothetical protein T440DRAFT_463043 [Plenodomus tracheiphilus IPT5]|uniref:EF-hand n=1 Tax=Plenodomus tracheiphilus IPT5 TaxID=1408161 RepID=A0A6A7BN14_9PLEO|nr:hypothetical protein T440DRAFT_463043 [Plenodomus tracheiphilus IPT5]
MPSSTPSSLRYRPAILVFTGAAAAYAGYLVYSSIQASPGDGLRRSNAVRRRSRRRESAAARAAVRDTARNEQEPTSLGEVEIEGASISLNPHGLVRVGELHDIIMQARPDFSREEVTNAIDRVYDIFFDRFLRAEFRDRVPSADEVDAIREWIGDRVPDQTAIQRAVERHAQGFAQDGATALDDAESIAGTDLSWGSEDDDGDGALDQDGQTLQRTLYHIAEDRARQDGVVHRGITCNGCDEKPIRGVRWHCANCVDFDLCSTCEATNSHYKTHIFYKVRIPAPHLNLQRQEVLYPGKPHKMSISIDPGLKKRLVSETKMEAEEIEALWDQFTCLAGSKWHEDPNSVYYALDRRAFNHVFVPRYNTFTAAPNLIYDRIFAYYDTDKNGLIGIDEWIKGIDGMHTTDVEVKARIVFNGYDIDGDGYVSRRDLLRIFRAFYAMEKEATQNYVAGLTDDYAPRNQMKKIRSSQPLGSGFSPHDIVPVPMDQTRLLKSYDDDSNTTPVLRDGNSDLATRESMLSATRESILRANDIPRGHPLERELSGTVADRWTRRQFYTDEEEGMSPPRGPREDNEAANGATEQNGTPSHASGPAGPIGESWGGFEIPKPEKDLGKEVLYQISQEGFNELLDPLFQEKEDLAMDVHETRSMRRKNAPAIDKMLGLFDTYKEDAEAIAQIGFFRYTKGVVELFCSEFEHASREGTLQDATRSDNGVGFDREKFKHLLYQQYSHNEDILHRVLRKQIIKASGYKEPDTMTLWNIILCMLQFREEVLHAAFQCVDSLGWFKPSDSGKTSAVNSDQTLPQFRPNSSADTYTTWTSTSSLFYEEENSHTTEEPTIHGYKSPVSGYSTPIDRHSNTLGDHVVSAPEGPFFVYTDPNTTIADSEGHADAEGETIVPDPPTDPADATIQPSAFISESNPIELPTQQFEHIPPEIREKALSQRSSLYWRSFTNDPDMHRFSISSINSTTAILNVNSKPASHSLYTPYNPALDPFKPVVRRIRQRAMDPSSKLHITMLASLQLVEKEISERKGSGLIASEEFAVFMREGKLRFLEGWMEWVSI